MVCSSELHRGLNFHDLINVRRYCNEDIKANFFAMKKTDFKGLFLLFDVVMAIANTYEKPKILLLTCLLPHLVTWVNKTQALKTLLSHLKDTF